VGDAHRAACRSIRAAARCVRAVTGADDDEDTQDVQTSAGDGDDEGSRSLDFRRRQAERMALESALA